MKQIIQSYKTGELMIVEVPVPQCEPEGVVVQTMYSVISGGTERMIVDIARKSLVGKALERPDLVMQVLKKIKTEGIKGTYEKVMSKLENPVPMGYSCAGRVIEAGDRVKNIKVGDLAACGGAGYANHAEYNYVPQNLVVRIPDGVSIRDASYSTIGSIALQGVRQAEPQLNEVFVVIGSGLIGLITIQLLKANGVHVIASDIDPSKLEIARSMGADIACPAPDLSNSVLSISNGFGADCVIITASSKESSIMQNAGDLCRLRGRIIVVGDVPMDVPRNEFYKKELTIRLSMSYGPGRYDYNYEEKGIDYPYSYVRFTEQRNMETVLEMIRKVSLNVGRLTTHSFSFDKVLDAYELLKSNEKYIGIVLEYRDTGGLDALGLRLSPKDTTISSKSRISIGIIGAGNFGKGVLIPKICRLKDAAVESIASKSGTSAALTAKRYNISTVCEKASDVINNPDINSVFILTRHNLHGKMVVDALKAGKHVFVEKPLCINLEELQEIKNTYESLKEKPVLFVGYNRRFSPFVLKILEFFKNRISPVIIHYRINAGFIPDNNWIQDLEVGGGRIIGEVCHFIDFISAVTGEVPVSVYAKSLRMSGGKYLENDNVMITLGFSRGSAADIHYFACGPSSLPKEEVEIYSDGKGVILKDFKSTEFHGKNRKSIAFAGQEKGFDEELEAFVQGIKSGALPVDFHSLYLTTLATIYAEKSLRDGKEYGLR
jgi:predicted dehydrogenase/threonine dehydrogenase-like Zn-dependent dehydrogenase